MANIAFRTPAPNLNPYRDFRATVPALAVRVVRIGLDATVPTISATTTNGNGASIAFDTPFPTLSITGTLGRSTSVALDTTVPTLSIRTGARLALETPGPTITGTASVGLLSSVALETPVPTLAITARAGQTFSLNLSTPAPTLSGTGLSGTLGSASLSTPVPLLLATGRNGTIASIALSTPVPALNITHLGGNIVSINLDTAFPILLIGASQAATVSVITSPDMLSGTGSLMYAMNMKHTGLSSWSGFRADSIAVFNDKLIRFDQDGIWEQTGTKDNAVDIDMRLKTGLSDMTDPMTKRLPEIAIVMEGDTQAKVLVETNLGDEYEYKIEKYAAGGKHSNRVKPGRGLRASLYAIEMRNYRGDALEVTSIKPMPLATRRKVG